MYPEILKQRVLQITCKCLKGIYNVHNDVPRLLVNDKTRRLSLAPPRPIPTRSTPRLARLCRPHTRGRRRLARGRRIRVRERCVRRRLKVHVARRPALANPDRLQG